MKARLQRVVAAVTDNAVVKRVMAVLDIANTAGVPLLSMALAFTTMFAILPLVLLLSGALGWVVSDPQVRAQLLAQLVAYLPPLAPLFEESIEGAIRAREALSIVGLLGLLWGASNFYAALDEVMRRLFPGGHIRGFISRRVRGVLAVLVLILLVLGTIVLGGLWAFVQTSFGGLSELLSYAMPLISIALITLVVLVVYRHVPTAPPGRRAALPPAIVAGIGIGLLTNLFTVLAPLLVGGLSAFGVVATVFAVFVWLNLCFQVLLFGAAWARYRRDRLRLEGAAPE